jgi:hypothetical protein
VNEQRQSRHAMVRCFVDDVRLPPRRPSTRSFVAAGLISEIDMYETLAESSKTTFCPN